MTEWIGPIGQTGRGKAYIMQQAIEGGRLPEQRRYFITIEREGRTRATHRHPAAYVEVWAWDMYGALKEALSYLARHVTEPRLGDLPKNVKVPTVLQGKVEEK